ncbi:MAG: AAA family ATPase, partial [Deltaproteobacteria bacterium]|nr:AAA family ATPase [Deltaproteobacteria bacterium]
MVSSETPGQVIIFYSYKGGTGRSMALANVACVLAQRYPESHGVLMVDWDLEAPGLHRFFRGKFTHRFGSTDDRPFDEHLGLIDLFWELDATTRSANGTSAGQTEEEADVLLRETDLERFVLKTDIPSLSLLKAGRFDDKYSLRVNIFQWEAFYNRSPWLIRSFAERLAEQYRYVLIDSRTGLTDISGICTMLMPEKLVVVFTPNRQRLTGLEDLIRRATNYRRQSDDLRPLVVFPLPSRIEATRLLLHKDWRYGSPEKEIIGYQPRFEKLFKVVYDLPECDLTAYFDEVQIQHIPDYAYGEEIAVLIERGGDRLSLTRSYESFTARLVNLTAPWGDLDLTTAQTPTETLRTVYLVPQVSEVCPYRGLHPFRGEDAPFFFGREAFTARLAEMVERQGLVAVVGASGSGKSSVVFAGLIPRLHHEGSWLIASFRPGDRPFHALAAALMPLLEPQMSQADRPSEIGKLAGQLQQGDRTLQDVLEHIAQQNPGAHRLLLVADQFEELYTLCRSEQVRRRFLDGLLEVIAMRLLAVVLTLRADFYGHALGYRPFADRLQDAVVNLGPMTREELKRAVEAPAQKVELEFEPGLVERILDDVGEEPGNLPLLNQTTGDSYTHTLEPEYSSVRHAHEKQRRTDVRAAHATLSVPMSCVS